MVKQFDPAPAVFISREGAERFGRAFAAVKGRGWRFSVAAVYRRGALTGWGASVRQPCPAGQWVRIRNGDVDRLTCAAAA